MSDTLRLHYAPDNASLIVRLALEELQCPYETVLVDRSMKAQKSAGYLALNPHGLIPVLETPNGALFETAAILLWLTEQQIHTNGQSDLAPAPGAATRGDFLKWLFFISNGLHADLRLQFYPQQYTNAEGHKALRRGVQARLNQHLDRLEALLASAPPWFGQEAPSVLDFYVATLLRWMALYPSPEDSAWFTLATRPDLHALAARLEQRPSAQRASQLEGLGPKPFSQPIPAQPPEGVAL